MNVQNVPDAEGVTNDPAGYGKDLFWFGTSAGLAVGAAAVAYKSLGKPVANFAQSGVNRLASEAGEAANDGFDFQ